MVEKDQLTETVNEITQAHPLEATLSLRDQVHLRAMIKAAYLLGSRSEHTYIKDEIIPSLIDEAMGKGILIGRLQALKSALGRAPKIREIGYRNQIAKSFGSFSRALEIADGAEVVVPAKQMIILAEVEAEGEEANVA